MSFLFLTLAALWLGMVELLLFVMHMQREVGDLDAMNKIVSLFVILLGSNEHVRSPYLRARMVEVCVLQYMSTRTHAYIIYIYLNTHKNFRKKAVCNPAWLQRAQFLRARMLGQLFFTSHFLFVCINTCIGVALRHTHAHSCAI